MNSKIDPEDDKKFKCICKTEKEHKENCVFKESEYYWTKYKQSDLDMYFKCDNSKCKDFGRRYPYTNLLEMYSEYCAFDCFKCNKKMIVTLEKRENNRDFPRNIDIQMSYLK